MTVIFNHRFLDHNLDPLALSPWIAGHGIGPEIADAVRMIFSTAKVPINWEVQEIGKQVRILWYIMLKVPSPRIEFAQFTTQGGIGGGIKSAIREIEYYLLY